MMNVDYYIKGNKIQAPFNHKELSIELNFDKDSPDARLQINKWRFVNDSAKVIYNEYLAGLSGGVGIFEGIPYDIVISKLSQSLKFEMFLDLTGGDVRLSCFDVECESKERGKIEWLNTTADSFTFEYLYKEAGFIGDGDFVSVPYVINSIPNYKDIIIALVSTTFIITTLTENISYIFENYVSASNPFQAADIVKVVIRIIYIIGLLVTFIKLIIDIFDLLIQPVKYHKGMFVNKAIQAACSYLGLTYQSSILQSDPWDKLFILPRKTENPPDSLDERILGFTSPNNAQQGYLEGTLGDLLRSIKTMFNAKIIIDNGVLRIERIDYNNSGATYVIPDVRIDTYGTNASEINSNVLIEFGYDVNDKNTVQQWLGTVCQITTSPLSVNNSDMVLMQNLKTVSIPYALAKRKEDLTLPEKVFDLFFTAIGGVLNLLVGVVNAAIAVVNFIGDAIELIEDVADFFGVNVNIDIPDIPKLPPFDLGSVINDRLGMLMLENDSVLQPKIMLLRQGDIDRETDIIENNREVVNARFLWDNFHYIDSFVEINGVHNQWIRKQATGVPFTFDDYVKVKSNNKIIDSEGNIAKIESLKWNIWNQTADFEFRVNKKYTNNLKLTVNESQGY